MSSAELALLAGAGLVAGIVNSLAGGGSLLAVSLLVLFGLPGNVANGTNRAGVLLQNAAAAWRFRASGVPGGRDALPLLVPVTLGSLAGAFLISRVADETFERLFGIVMVAMLVPILRRSHPSPAARLSASPSPRRTWSPPVSFALFFAIGAYGGAFQAGVGIPLLFALSFAGFDLVRANSVKTVVILAVTAVALPVFLLRGQIAWLPAAALAAGYAAGGELGARLAVRGGERIVRPVLACAVIALAGRMLGLY